MSQPPPKRTKLADAQKESVDTDALLWGIEPSEETPEEAPVVDETQPEDAPVDLRPHKCSYADCGKDYALPGQLTRHVKLVHVEKNLVRPHKCSYDGCIKDYPDKSGLDKHVSLFHLKERNFPCTWDGCNVACASASALKTHMDTHTGYKGFSCTWAGCGKFFSQSGSLEVHIRSHNGDKRYECSWEGCGKTFVTSSECTKHIRIHNGEKPYECTWAGCGKTFAQSGGLQMHIRSNHTGEKPIHCQWEGCDCTFTNCSGLLQHEMLHHKDQNSSEVKEFREKRNANTRKRYKEDKAFRVHHLCKSRFHRWKEAEGGVKTMRMEALVGILWAELVIWLEDNEEGLTVGMDGVDIDHWRPVSSFDLFDPIQLRQCWSYRNLRLMRSGENRSKGAKYNAEEYAATSAGKAIAELRKGWAVEFPEYA